MRVDCSQTESRRSSWKTKTEKKNKQVIYRPRSVRIGKNCALGLALGPRPAASGLTPDGGHSFFLYGPPGRQITYIFNFVVRYLESQFTLLTYNRHYDNILQPKAN